jgi:hypothetical protein
MRRGECVRTTLVHKVDNYLTDYLLLEVECSSDDCNGIVVEVTTVVARRRVHGDELLQLWRSGRVSTLAGGQNSLQFRSPVRL